MKIIPSSVRIVIPAYNAAGTLPAFLKALQQVVPTDVLLVVDDGSDDGTALIAGEAGVRSVRHSKNRGKGAALKTGLRAALLDPAVQSVITMDADGQHDPADLPGLYDAWRQTGADLVIGSRSIAGSRMPLDRRLSNVITSFLVTSRTGVRVADSQCGYRVLSRRCAEMVVPDADGFEAETEWIIRAARLGMSITSAPVQTVYSGERSHMKKWATTKAFIRVLLREYAWVD